MKFLGILSVLLFTFTCFAVESQKAEKIQPGTKITVEVGEQYSSSYECMLSGYHNNATVACASGAATKEAFDLCKVDCQYCVLKEVKTNHLITRGRKSIAHVTAAFTGLNCNPL